VPTFENGWICRECWCANREHDARCYRCHAQRPDFVAPAVASSKPKPSSETVVQPPAPVVAAVQEDLPPAPVVPKAGPRTHFCLTCGRPLLPGAAFCTQCGTPTAEQASVDADQPPAPAAPTAAPRKMPRPAMPPLGTWLAALRVRYAAYVQRHIVVWELSMAGLALAFLAIGILSEQVDGGFQGALLTLGWLVTIVFVTEFVSRLAVAADPRAHLRRHWIDLLALVPILRPARVLSLYGLLPMVPGVGRVTGSIRAVQRTFRNRAQLWLFLAWLAVMLVCSVFLYGYAISPSTGVARLAGGVLLVMGLALFSALTAALTNLLLAARHDPAAAMTEQLRALGALREAGLVSGDEYGTRRAAIMSSLTPHEGGQSSS
jgi:uncharacterized membrane protein YjjB (DUF3815 family)